MKAGNVNKVRIIFFATIKDIVGQKEITLEISEDATVRDVKQRLSSQYPDLSPYMGTTLISVNREYAFDNELLPKGAEVALFPPVSGGSISEPPSFFAIQEENIDIDALISEITVPETGAVCTFTGTVRKVTKKGNNHETDYLEYEAYQPMAEKKMHQIADEIRERWPDVVGIAIVQRVGQLDPGATTVVIACSAAHRDMGVFEAARYGIDRLKEIVPVWKKEVSPNGEEWLEGHFHPTMKNK